MEETVKQIYCRMLANFVAMLSLVLMLDMLKEMVTDCTMLFNLYIARDLWDTVMLYVILSYTVKKQCSKIHLFFLYGLLYFFIRIGETFSEIRLDIGSPINYVLLLLTLGIMSQWLRSFGKTK